MQTESLLARPYTNDKEMRRIRHLRGEHIRDSSSAGTLTKQLAF